MVWNPKIYNLEFKKNYLIFLIMFYVFKVCLGIVNTHLTYQCPKCLFHMEKLNTWFIIALLEKAKPTMVDSSSDNAKALIRNICSQPFPCPSHHTRQCAKGSCNICCNSPVRITTQDHRPRYSARCVANPPFTSTNKIVLQGMLQYVFWLQRCVARCFIIPLREGFN